MRVSVVIPNWNGRKYLETLFPDLGEQTMQPDEIILVDNGSADGSAKFAARCGARVLRFERNRGFAAAVNAGVAETSGEVAAVINNDVRLEKRWLEHLCGGLGQASFATGKVLSLADPDRIDCTFDAVCGGGAAWRCGSGRRDGPEWSRSRTIQFPPFTAVLIRKDAFLEAGGLDERYESYLEDVDFGFRSGSKGHTGVYIPDAVAWHRGSGTLGVWHHKTVRQIARNQIFLVALHFPGPLLRRFGWRIAVAHILWGAIACRHGRLIPWLSGKWEGISRFRELRRQGSETVASLLKASEDDILSLQRKTGFDTYWRLYFGLTQW